MRETVISFISQCVMGQMVTTVVFTKDRQRQKNRGGALALECTQDSVQFFRIPE